MECQVICQILDVYYVEISFKLLSASATIVLDSDPSSRLRPPPVSSASFAPDGTTATSLLFQASPATMRQA
ncbi:MAG: hypothetical protein EZS28_025516 [Streblomastix strix]|uniref:Uncharacterized protein n=1 Tax=Streblomastix strix TaxID=222440 RepID=A0A5J4V8V6_9EUKA|nr:MAG: hypothetical protein EZS28_025516 [Streblomastix strix]